MPEIAPEPVPVPKPGNPKHAAPVCKRADSGCAPGHIYTFSGTNYVEKGRALRERVQGVFGKNEARDHNYNNEEGRYLIQTDKNVRVQIDSRVESFFKQQGIDMGNFMTRDNSWTRYRVHGTRDEAKIKKNPPAVDVYVSVKRKAMIPQRLFKSDPKDELYTIPLAERLPMSEWLFQLWKKAVQESQTDHGVHVGDLQ